MECASIENHVTFHQARKVKVSIFGSYFKSAWSWQKSVNILVDCVLSDEKSMLKDLKVLEYQTYTIIDNRYIWNIKAYKILVKSNYVIRN